MSPIWKTSILTGTFFCNFLQQGSSSILNYNTWSYNSETESLNARFGTLKAEVSEEILNWHIVLVLVHNFESFFCDLLASVSLVNKNRCKGQH